MHRFFVDPSDINLDLGKISIKGEDVKHIKKVLRLKEGQEVEVSDGLGNEYIVVIDRMGKDILDACIKEKSISNKESDLRITLFQSIPKSTKMDFIIQKCTELGVHSIVPIVTKRSIVQLDTPKAKEKKLERWQRIAYEAAKQSKRDRIPKIEALQDFNDIWNQIRQNDVNLVAYENEKAKGIKELIKNQCPPIYNNIGVIVGPEGGFEEHEIKALEDKGVFSISLGPRILRTETAGIVLLAILMYELGDLGGFLK